MAKGVVQPRKVDVFTLYLNIIHIIIYLINGFVKKQLFIVPCISQIQYGAIDVTDFWSQGMQEPSSNGVDAPDVFWSLYDFCSLF